MLYYEVPRDGKYVVEINDSVFRGREDFVYRMSIGELPFVTGWFPLGGKVGEETNISLLGWNLPYDHFAVDARAANPGLLALRRVAEWDRSTTSTMPSTRCPSAWSKSLTIRPNMPSR